MTEITIKPDLNSVYVPYLYQLEVNELGEEELVFRKERFQVFYGGAGSGKSHFVATDLIMRLVEKKQKLLVVRQTFNSHRDSTFSELNQAIERLGLKEKAKVSKTTLEIELWNGSTIIFKGADDEGKLLSISDISLCWIEEATEISREIFHQLQLRLRSRKASNHFFLTFNPISALHWLKAEFFDNPKKNSFICHTTYLDNKFLSEDYIADLLDMKERNPQKYEIFALGRWGTTGRAVFTNWQVLDFDRHEIVRENPKIEVALGMDWGYIKDPSTMICSLVDLENRIIYIFDEMYEHGLLNNEIATRIFEKGYHRERIIADSAEKKSIDELIGYGIQRIEPAVKGNGSIMQGIQFIQQFKIFVHPRCIHTIDELENYTFKKDPKTGQYLNQAIDDYNHLLDALRYSLERFSKKGRKKMKAMSKRLFGL